MLDYHPPKSVVVGIDGSDAAVRAALWAADKVAGTDTALRLLCISEQTLTDNPREAQRALVTAEAAVNDAYRAIDATGKPVKVEMQILDGRPVPALIHASDPTTLLCVGGTGSTHPGDDGFGSTAAELLRSAPCSVAVVRGRRDVAATDDRRIVAAVSESLDESNGVLQAAFEEAQRRNAPLAVVAAWQSGFDDLQNDRAIDDSDRLARHRLDRELALWTPRYPEVDLRAVVVYGTFLSYLSKHARTIEMVMVGAAHARELQQLVGPAGALALRGSDFSLLLVR
ncbi:MAG: universal stress protein [Mycobacterium sp.]|nr:universal stress protein [Mycobacterium sp.]